jgi:amino acid adenylation domain-containing protein
MLTAAAPAPSRRQRLLAALLEKTGVKPAIHRIPRRSGDAARAPLSSGQQRLWFLDRLAPGNPVYNVPTSFRVRGRLDARAFAGALSEIVRRHEILRTTFAVEGGEPVQVIAPGLRFSISQVNLAAAPAEVRDHEAHRLAIEEARRPFDLEQGPLMRATLFRLAPDDHLVLITMHHIVCDGWSIGVLFRELAAIYEVLVAGGPSRLAELPVQFGDFAAWERERIAGGALDGQLAYWRELLNAAPESLDLAVDRRRPRESSYRGAIVRREVGENVAARLREIAARQSATPFAVLLSAFAGFLHRYSGAEDLVIGCPVANRRRAELNDLIGFFPNTLPLRIDVEGDPPFEELVARVQQRSAAAFANAEAPLEMIANGRGPLFEVAFLFQDAPPAGMRFGDLQITPVELDLGTAKCDLTLAASLSGAGLSLAFEYSADRYEPATVERMSRHFERLLGGIAADPSTRVSRLPLQSGEEQRRLVYEWNRTNEPFPEDCCAHELFEQRVSLHPNAPALRFRDEVVTYAQLNRRANGFAWKLRGMGVGPDVLAAIALKRSPEMIAAMLGVMKAGGAYVPLSLDHPPDRIALLVEDARPRVLVTTPEDRALLPEAALQLPWVDAGSRCEDADNLGRIAGPLNLAYVIYTSGSTGRPKGVLLEHRGLCNLAVAQQRLFELGPGCRVLQFAAPTFDASVWEIFMALASGACLSLGNGAAFTPEELAQVLREHHISTVTLPPSLLRVLTPSDFPALHTVISAGESCSEELAERWSAACSFFNAYGPTEATVCATVARCAGGRRVAIGRPIANMRVHVLDSQMRPVPVGAPGELYIGGAGVARGYLRRPELDRVSFITDPFEPGGRLYKTGDWARRLADGQIEFLGRVDSQVKIRGHRIEPGEIEARLEMHPRVLQSAVVSRQGASQLIAYFTARGAAPDAAELRAFAAAALPSYMVPDLFVALERLPVNASGKIDRRALAQMTPPQPRERVAPHDVLEREIARVWEEVLGVTGIGVTDDFFELGGNSLLTVKLMRGIRAATGCELPLSAIYQGATIERIAAVVRANGRRDSEPRVIPLQPHGVGQPLVLVHPAGGSVICYHELARELRRICPVYGIEPPAEQAAGVTIPSMAMQYIDALRSASIRGPYRLGGWSSGGVIAYEMARQLARAGEEVEIVVLIDAWAKAPEWEPDEVELLAEVGRTVAAMRGTRRAFKARRLRALAERDRIAAVAAELGGETVEQEIRTTLHNFRANIRAARTYVAGPYHGRVVLFHASDLRGSEDRGWGPVASKLRIRQAAGKHGTMLFAPHVRDLAREIRNCLTG